MKSTRMYSASPMIKRGEDGVVAIMRPSPASMDDMSLRGQTGSYGGGDGTAEMPVQTKQIMERMALHKKHEADRTGMHSKHEAEYTEMVARHSAEPGGEQIISNIEGIS